MSTLGERLKLARERTGLKQTQVKERTNINNKTLSGYENNVSEPDSATLGVLAELYGVSYRWLITGEGPMVEKPVNKLSDKDERDIAKRMEKIKEDLAADGGLSFYGEPLSEEAKESLLEAMEFAVRQAQKINKKYIPKKYREDQ
ncbi:helix-turn-helix transcriptional regulator [Bacillus thermocopriae]|uniref:Helix-turn-helix transcriptional regulator n=1 Tax=Neobacillus thermocopriae TaxID=1215031 RepID=A0A6B3TM40_9BACI|nr:helix-turn-helix transcriptional regulator [Neobacillus thermocopriae]NEX77406.1 helix-turn-helix transcriptional regulator [Neobacillus thermocopriae]